MKVTTTYYLELEVEVTCSVEKGDPETGSHDQICDKEYTYDIKKTIELDEHLIEEDIWEEVKNIQDSYIEDRR